METPAKIEPSAKLSNTFTIKVRLGKGEGFVTFRKPKANQDIKPEYDAKDPSSWADFLCKQIVSSDGILNEDGTELTIEQVLKRDIPIDLWAILVHGYLAGVAKPQGKEAAEKNFEVLD